MTKLSWFSTKLRFAIMVEPEGADTLNDCIFLLQAKDFQDAFARALMAGEKQESRYLNQQGRQVVWAFMEIMSLDILQTDMLDGAELYSTSVHLEPDAIIPFDTKFAPRTSKPIQTI